MGTFTKTQMQYNDGHYYKWNANDDHDNPYYTKGTDYSELNRTEGYEVLFFINHFGDKHQNVTGTPTLATYHKIEKMIRYTVPSNIRTHAKIADWLVANWSAH